MSAHRLTEIRCDGCDEAKSEWGVSVAWLRRALSEIGWRSTGRRDCCPRCVAQEARRD